jgi:hypothetical protein
MYQWFAPKRYSGSYKLRNNMPPGDILEHLSGAAVTKEKNPARWNQKLTAALSTSARTL